MTAQIAKLTNTVVAIENEAPELVIYVYNLVTEFII
jgi:hypothetical protein